jgi:hypothetical protein
MKTERKFTWCVRYYDVISGTVSYREFIGLTVREINEEVKDFISSNDNFVVRIFKNYKCFGYGE